MAWNLDSDRSIYLQIIEIIQKRIITGTYKPGSRLDSVRDLAQEAGVNPNTMQRALGELERTGIIRTERTSGKFVTEDENMIEELRMKLAEETLNRMLSEMEELGFSKSEVEDLIRRTER